MKNILARIPLFSDLPSEELDRIVSVLVIRELQAGELLFHEGDAGDELYVVARGELQVMLGEGKPDELVLNVLRDGEYFGEMGLILPGGHRTASVRAREPSVLLSLSRTQFSDLTARYPVLSASMLHVLSRRLDATNTATFNDLTEKNRQLQQAYDELKEAQGQLVEKERLERELQVAAEIQFSILPDALPNLPNFDFGARILPARQVGGDFYDVFPVADHIMGVLIGDVSDKGVPAALFMARSHALIMAEADTGMSPGEVMHLVNGHITRLQKSTQFVTALYGLLDDRTGEFSFARAGHEPPLLLRTDGSVERLPHGPGMSLGMWETIKMDERSLRLPPGSTLVLFTDGLTDCRNPEGEAFGLERIKSTLAGLAGLSAQKVCDHLFDALQAYQNGASQDDDVTLVAIHVA
jgi:phosphoserine phosphatase RsbU/P